MNDEKSAMPDAGFCGRFCRETGVREGAKPDLMHPLSLAYVGDAVFDLCVRTLLVQRHEAKPHALHSMASKRVRASAQAKALAAIAPLLTEEEADHVRRARNSKPGTLPKHASPEDYAQATGFEALLGWLYLSGREERMLALVKTALESQGADDVEIKRAFRPKR